MKVTNYFLLHTILDSGFIAIKLGCSRKIITVIFGSKMLIITQTDASAIPNTSSKVE